MYTIFFFLLFFFHISSTFRSEIYIYSGEEFNPVSETDIETYISDSVLPSRISFLDPAINFHS